MFGGRFRFLAGSYAGLLSPFGPLVASLMFMPYNHLRTLTFQPKNELERFQIVPTCRTPLPSGQHARRPHLRMRWRALSSPKSPLDLWR